MVKIQQLPNGQLVLTIPKRLAELKGWEKGMVIQFSEHSEHGFVIKKEEKKKEAQRGTP